MERKWGLGWAGQLLKNGASLLHEDRHTDMKPVSALSELSERA